MNEKSSTNLILLTVAFLAAFVLSLVRSEYFFGIISLGFSLLVYTLGFLFARHNDSKDLSRQFEN
ncbi:MAG: hypothetical protein M0Q21_10880 [Ignavibacteriaceae bacterium]|nr:hypothetical protein [Ignavibacteriaceae bacterium]